MAYKGNDVFLGLDALEEENSACVHVYIYISISERMCVYIYYKNRMLICPKTS